MLDHHVSSDDLGAEQFKDVQAEATGRLVLQAAQQLGVKLTQEIATPLFAAIATDTGWFRFASTTGDTYRAAGALVDRGARPNAIYNSLYEQDTLARLNLIGRVLARAKTELDGRLIYHLRVARRFQSHRRHFRPTPKTSSTSRSTCAARRWRSSWSSSPAATRK